jgi:hypothetical protein
MRGCCLGKPLAFISPIPSLKARVFFWKKDKKIFNKKSPIRKIRGIG